MNAAEHAARLRGMTGQLYPIILHDHEAREIADLLERVPGEPDGLPLDDDAFRSRLGTLMEIVRQCDQQTDDSGLCTCARIIGHSLRLAMHHGDIIASTLERVIAESDEWRSKYIALRRGEPIPVETADAG